MLVGAARLLSARRDQFAGSVIFMFQPGEEHDAGARLMIEEGVLDAAGERPVAAYALHVASAFLRTGQFGTRSGALTSSSDELHVTVTGVGGHGATPALTKDPIAAACAMITTLHARVVRDFSWGDPVIASIGTLHAGDAVNVIPAEARFAGTIRSFSVHTRERIITAIREVTHAVAAAYGVRADVTIREGYPAVINDPAETRIVAEAAREIAGPDGVTYFATPVPAAEDFAFILSEVPGAYLFLGASAADGNPLTVPFNHAPEVIFDDAVMADGAALLAAVTLRRLA
jgi:hippurate hydrolase